MRTLVIGAAAIELGLKDDGCFAWPNTVTKRIHFDIAPLLIKSNWDALDCLSSRTCLGGLVPIVPHPAYTEQPILSLQLKGSGEYNGSHLAPDNTGIIPGEANPINRQHPINRQPVRRRGYF